MGCLHPILVLVLALTISCTAAQKKCHYNDLYLIYSGSETSCTKPSARDVVDIDRRTVKIERDTRNTRGDSGLSKDIIKLPGCFYISFDMILKDGYRSLPRSYLAKMEYQWWNFPKFSELKCQNSSNNGCGGFGNNCYYCDVCQNLKQIEKGQNPTGIPYTDSQSDIVDQFKGLRCPNNPGRTRFKRRFCFNDWRGFDEDEDCKPDFLQGKTFTEYKNAFKSLEQIGFGSLFAFFKIAHNATEQQTSLRIKNERAAKEKALRELDTRGGDWNVKRRNLPSFRRWYVQYSKDAWHRNKFLDYLLKKNEVSCLKVSFNVCDTPPKAHTRGGVRSYRC